MANSPQRNKPDSREPRQYCYRGFFIAVLQRNVVHPDADIAVPPLVVGTGDLYRPFFRQEEQLFARRRGLIELVIDVPI